jgi:uncharacterized protein (DUF1501 family)
MTDQTQSTESVSRRRFLALSGASLAGVMAAPSLLAGGTQRLNARVPEDDVVVTVYLRGGADGLMLVAPYGDARYAALRPTLGWLPPDAKGVNWARACIDLDGFFGLAPAMGELALLFHDGRMLVAPACGLSVPIRSHALAQRALEVGAVDSPGDEPGWLARHVDGVGEARAEAAAKGYAFGPLIASALDGMRDIEVRSSRGGTNEEAFVDAMSETARLIREEANTRAFAIEFDGWDTHADQGAVNGHGASMMRALAAGLGAFHRSTIERTSRRVTVFVLSEFGRRVRENEAGGTEHGRAGAVLVLGTHMRGGIVGAWPGLGDRQLEDGHDLRVTTDVHALIASVLDAHSVA